MRGRKVLVDLLREDGWERVFFTSGYARELEPGDLIVRVDEDSWVRSHLELDGWWIASGAFSGRDYDHWLRESARCVVRVLELKIERGLTVAYVFGLDTPVRLWGWEYAPPQKRWWTKRVAKS